MKATLLITAACLVMLAIGSAQERKQATPAMPSASALEAKVREAWADFKNKNKSGFAAALADDFVEVEDDGDGPRDKKTEVAEIDQFELSQYTLKDFKTKPIGADGALVTYMSEYSGTAAGQPLHQKSAFSEIWVRHGNNWKQLYAQETKVK